LLALLYQGRESASADVAGRGQQQGPGVPGGNFMGNRPPLVGVGKVARGVIREQISLVGSLKPKEQVQVVPRITGKVEQVLVNVGDNVRQGQLLATLEGEELDQQVLRAEASLAVSQATLSQRQAELENAQADEARTAQLASEGLVSVQVRQTAETRGRVVEAQLRLAQAQVRAAEADLAELKIRQQQLQVVAPLSGAVGQRFVDPGALVSANSPIVSVLALSSLITEVRVPEEHLANLRAGNRAVVAIDALGGQTMEGRVARISPVLDAATRSGLLQVEIPNTGGQLKAEMSARIVLDVGSEREALLVPGEAVVVRGLQTGVHLLEGNRVRFQPIETGISTDQGVEVLEGVTVGTAIVTKGSQSLQNGTIVETPGGLPTGPEGGNRS
jgi:RND family efflux transporter MFP subunit